MTLGKSILRKKVSNELVEATNSCDVELHRADIVPIDASFFGVVLETMTEPMGNT